MKGKLDTVDKLMLGLSLLNEAWETSNEHKFQLATRLIKASELDITESFQDKGEAIDYPFPRGKRGGPGTGSDQGGMGGTFLQG